MASPQIARAQPRRRAGPTSARRMLAEGSRNDSPGALGAGAFDKPYTAGIIVAMRRSIATFARSNARSSYALSRAAPSSCSCAGAITAP